MRKVFFKHYFLVSVLLMGCMQSQKDSSTLKFTDMSSDKNGRAPANDPVPTSPDDLASEQEQKNDPAKCENGWILKNNDNIKNHFASAKAALESRSCINCHNSNSNSYAKLNYSSTEDFLGKKGIRNDVLLINPLELKNSLLLTKLANYGGSMPSLSESELKTVKEWIKSIDFECLVEKEVEKTETTQIKNNDVVLEKSITTFTTSKSKRQVSTIKATLPTKLEATLTTAEDGSNVITSEEIQTQKNLSKDAAKDKYKVASSYASALKNHILKVDEKNTYTTFDNNTFSLNMSFNINLKTGAVGKSAVTLNDVPAVKKNELNKIETTITTTASYKNGIATVNQQTKTLSKNDNSYTVKQRTYTVDSAKLTYVDKIVDFGPKNSVSIANGIRTEIIITSYIKDGKTYLEKKVIKSLADGSLIDGEYSGLNVIGSSVTVSEIDGSNFNYATIPLKTDKTVKPTRVCDLAAVEKTVESQSTSASGRYLASKNTAIRFADRYYVLSVLHKVFGSAVMGTASSINTMNTIFGGNFDAYDIVKDDVTLKTINTSPEGYPLTAVNSTPNGDLIGPLNPIRVATTIKTCEDIVKNNTLLLNAIKNATNDQTLTTAKLPYPFKEDFINAYNLFYSADPIKDTTVNALICVADAEANALEQWRSIFLTLCITPEWQIP